MEHKTPAYKVYVKTDEQSIIIDVNSSAFLTNTEGWTKIDEGYGDKYYHAQGSYFDKPIFDERGIFRYRMQDGVPFERSQEEMGAEYAAQPSAPASDSERITQLEDALELLLSGVTE